MIFSPRPAVLGHRGLGRGVVAGHVENTLDSFLAAVQAGLSWVEVDVRRTGDDRLVVHHHPTLPDGRWVSETTAAESGLLLFEELLAALPTDVGVNVDAKSSVEDALRAPGATTAALLGAVAGREDARRPLVVTSFDPSLLLIVRERAPGVALGLLTWKWFPLRKAVPAARHLDMQVVAAHAPSFAANRYDPAPVHREAAWTVDLAHRAGLEVVAWCPAVADAVELLAAGVDAVVVNDVPTALAALGEHDKK